MTVFSVVGTKPVGTVVEVLEEALGRAKSGETVGVVMLEVNKAREVAYSTAGIEDRWRTAGYLFSLLHRIQSDD